MFKSRTRIRKRRNLTMPFLLVLGVVLFGVNFGEWRDNAVSRAQLIVQWVGGFSGAAEARELIQGKVVGITDGDTITLLVNKTQHKVRLTEIDTPERGQPWGNRAQQALSKKIFREDVTIQSSGTDRYGRVLGRIFFGDRDINREMVAEGHAWVYRQYMTERSWLEDEEKARMAGLGLWGQSEPPVAPWDWRRGDRRVLVQGPRDESCGTKRYCREMTSCDEAMFYLRSCGLTRLDGDGDGVPCESICQ